MMRWIISLWLLVLTMTAWAERPNIVLIIADDVARDWISAYGAAHRTPNIDRLAAEGVKFTHAWATPLCTPTRVELLTGMYPFRTGWTQHHDVPRWGGVGLDPKRFVTWARVARDAGYATAIAGKWQINHLNAPADTLSRHGFDEHCMWTGVEAGNPASDKRYHDAFLQINGDRRTHAGKYGPDVVCDFAVDFIRRRKDQPFLLYYPMILVHSPYDAPPGHPAGGGDAQRYAAMVSYMDKLVGRVLSALDESGAAERTVVIFTTDNGSSVGGSIDGLKWTPGKGRVTNRGVHVPLIVRAPGLMKQAGFVSDALVDFTDVYPTIVELTGGTKPAEAELDGHSILPLLRGEAGRRGWIYSQLGSDRSVRDKRYRLNSSGGMFDVVADPLEQRDLSYSTDDEVVKARVRLTQVLGSMPVDAPPPFENFARAGGEAKKKKKAKQQ